MRMGQMGAEMEIALSDLPIRNRRDTMVSSPLVKARPRLTSVLIQARETQESEFFTMESNAEAYDCAMRFATGDVDLLALVGPTGWGKTSLLSAMQHRLTRRSEDASAPLLTASDWVHRSLQHDLGAPLLLDNVQDALETPKIRQSFLLALERRVRLGRPTALSFTSPKMTRQIRSVLPGSRSWSIAVIGSPSTKERERFVRHIARTMDMRLSGSLVYHIAQTMQGNGRTISGALKRLRMQQSAWLDDESTLRALGTLSPFCADCSEWDLRERIAETAEFLGSSSSPGARNGMIAHTMLHIARIPENEVAQHFGITPGAVYSLATGFQQAVKGDSQTRQALRTYVHNIVAGLRS